MKLFLLGVATGMVLAFVGIVMYVAYEIKSSDHA